MKKEMVVSSLTIYAIALSCFALLAGRSFAATPVQTEIAARQSDRRNSKAHVKSNVDVKDAVKQPESPRVLQSRYAPSNETKIPKISSEGIRTLNESHSFFALFDPVNNETKKFPVADGDRRLPSSATPDEAKFFEFKSNDRRNGKKSKSRHPWTEAVHHGKIRNFVARDTLRDSETETRVHFNGITAKETTVNTGVDEETGQRQGLKLRQLTDGVNFIQLIYSIDNQIQDCEFIRQKKMVHKFLSTFKNDVEKAKIIYEIDNEIASDDSGRRQERSVDSEVLTRRRRHQSYFEDDDDDDGYDEDLEDDESDIEKYSIDGDGDEDVDDSMDMDFEFNNVTFQIIESKEDLPVEISEWLNYKALKSECKRTHRLLKKLVHQKQHGDAHSKKLAEEHFERVKRGLELAMIAPGTKWCGRSQLAAKYTEIGGFTKTDKCCRAHDHCNPLIPPFDIRYGYFNFRPFTISHCRCDLRRKRDLMDMFRVPGTKWCGKGKRAAKYTSLGGFSRADKCCRIHDTTCPFWIGGFEEKYGLFNWRINTIMHCRCDKRFRACLKMAKTGVSNLVGKLFFNVVQTKCFVLKPQEVCLKKSWWGKCEKKHYQKKAYLKDNIPY